MQLALYQYVEINALGILLLFVMFQSIKRKHIYGENGEQRNFQQMLVVNALILIFDTAIYLMNGHRGTLQVICNHIFSCIYFVLHSWFCYFWIRYVFVRLHPRHKPTVREQVLLLLPTVFNTVLALSSPLTKLIYYITPDNFYHRGQYMYLTFAVGVVYCFVNTHLIVKEMLHPSLIRSTRTYVSLLLFPLAPIVGFVLQFYFYGLSLIWIFMAVDLLVLFIDMQNDLLSLDALTGLYNRRQVNTQLSWEVAHLHQASDFLFVAMLDVDHFKLINDKYGHLAGDRALTCVGKALKTSCRKNDFISRFGGDEFLITGHIANKDDVCVITNRINTTLTALNESEGLPCALSLSIGWALFSRNDTVTTDSILNEADSRMYEVKQRNHRSGACK